MKDRVRRWFAWLGKHNLVLLLAGLCVVGGAWGFAALADEVMEGDTQSFDDWMVRALRVKGDPATPIGPLWLHEAGRDITALGSVPVLALVTLAVVGYLLMVRKRLAMWLIIVATSTGVIASSLLKQVIGRERPVLVPHLTQVSDFSFPSGHSMLSALVYMTLGSLLAQFVSPAMVKLYCVAVALMLTFLVGISRIYMGVHYPTDVLAGWTAGLVWAIACWLLAQWLRRRLAAREPEES